MNMRSLTLSVCTLLAVVSVSTAVAQEAGEYRAYDDGHVKGSAQ